MSNNNLHHDKSKLNPGGLVLWRKTGETIQIGEDIFITVLSHNDHSGSRVRVVAPKNLRIERINEIPGSYSF